MDSFVVNFIINIRNLLEHKQYMINDNIPLYLHYIWFLAISNALFIITSV